MAFLSMAVIQSLTQTQSKPNMKAFYHPEAGRSVELDVAKKNDDGTFDLTFDGTLVVSSCKVTEEIEIGSCTIKTETKEKSNK